MSRRKTKPEDIRNPEHYFNRMIALEVQRDKEENEEYQKRFPSLEAMLEGGEAGPSSDTVMLLVSNESNDEFERHMADSTFLGWIDTVKNPILHSALQSLSDDDKALITLRYKECLSVRETAKRMHISKSSVDRSEQRIKKTIRAFFEKAGQTR